MSTAELRTLNSTRFLAAFSEIEAQLRRLLAVDVQLPFSRLVRDAAHRSRWIGRFANDLTEFAELRNAIVHRFRPEGPIAEPNDEVTRLIEGIARTLSQPPTVVPLFRRKVSVVEPATPIATAVRFMRSHEFSKLPVVNDKKIVGLLTTGAIAQWLGAEADSGIVDLEATCVSEVLKHTREPELFRVVAPTATLGDVVSLFLERQEIGRRLEAVLITVNGKPGGQIVGLVTTSDLPAAFRALWPEG